MKKSLVLACTSLLFFTSCALKESAVKTKDTIMTPVDKTTNLVEESYEGVSHFFSKISSSVSNGSSSLKNSLVDNSFSKYLFSDEYIIESRKDLVVWKNFNNQNEKTILKNYLKQKKINLSYKELSINTKLQLLNDYYFDLAQNAFKESIQRKYPKPKFDPFLTNRQNVNNFDEYNLNIYKANNIWERKLYHTKRLVLGSSLSSLYGNTKMKVINYNPYKDRLYIRILSSKNGFKQNGYLKLDSNTARALKEQRNIRPKVYFELDEKEFKLSGASLRFRGKGYLIYFSDENYIRDNKIVLNTNSKFDLKKEEINYQEIPKNINPPSWYTKIESSDDTIIGYGLSVDEKEARNNALQNIIQTISVKVSSKSSFEKKMSGDIITKKANKQINVVSDYTKLEGTKLLKTQKKDGLWFVAIEYKKSK